MAAMDKQLAIRRVRIAVSVAVAIVFFLVYFATLSLLGVAIRWPKIVVEITSAIP